jgi:hypothetical protein
VEKLAIPVLAHRLLMNNGDDPKLAVTAAVETARAALGLS